ncbi:hypothetical protein Pla22_41950 [Rubripirellula amarantea]|uniref:Uncharacterized protein n=1 Tax=Rubripirellula amarantea TaxID=2527999 RepID=A0A5C5WLB0_9BACT|nr:hypothetical protein Pla22_41950 [Rubripirellula amarantea]
MRFQWQKPLNEMKIVDWRLKIACTLSNLEIFNRQSSVCNQTLPAAIQPSARFPDRVTHQPMHREPFCTQHCRLLKTQG